MSQYTIPNVVSRDSRGERIVDVYSHLLSSRIVYIGTAIDDGVANAVIAQLLHLEAASPELPISLYINSPGGSLTAMTGIYDTMQYVRAPVATMCIGQAAADAAVLLAAGEAGQRTVLPHARVVLSQPKTDGGRATIPDPHSAPRTKWCDSATRSRRSSRGTRAAAASSCGRTSIGTWCSQRQMRSSSGWSTVS